MGEPGRSDRSPDRAAVAGFRLLRHYERRWIRPDLVAGLTVGAMLVPQSMAYAELAGVPATTGLYSSFLAPVAYALFGTSRHLGTGPEPGTAILAATGVAAVAGTAADPARYLALMAALALLVALVAGVAWLLRLGVVAQLLSKPVLVGYITGVGMVLLSSQLSGFTGVPITTGTFYPRVGEFLGSLSALRTGTLLLATGSLALLLVLRRVLPRAPGALIVVAAATAVTWALDLSSRSEAVIGPIPTGLPIPGVPDVGLADLRSLLPVALGVALVGYSDNMLTARAIAAKMDYRIDPNQELAGLASANLASGLVQGMPVSSSASRTAVPAALGSVTSLVGVIGASVVAMTLLFAGDLLAVVPRAALAAIIVAAAVSIIDLRGLRQLWQVSHAEMGLAIVTSLTVMVLDVLVGVVVAVALSIAVALVRMARPADAVLGGRDDVDGWVGVEDDSRARTLPGLLVYRFDAPLFFLNIEWFRMRLLKLLEANPGPEFWVVLDLEGVGDMDASAIDGLGDLLDELHRREVEVVAIARANRRTRQRLQRASLLEPDGPLRAFPTINAAVDAFQGRTTAPTDEGPGADPSDRPDVV